MIATYRAAMDKGYHTNKTILSNYKPPFTVDWSRFKGQHWTEHRPTRASRCRISRTIALKAASVPPNFKLHPRVEKVIADRRAMAEGTQPLDWGMGETLAYATLLDQNYGVRISGEDVGRGTFSHRHAVLHDQNREKWDSGTWIPLQHVKPGQPRLRDHRLRAHRGGGAGLRIRLLDLRAEPARGLGSAVRRFRQRRAGRDRPVRQLGRSRSGAASAVW